MPFEILADFKEREGASKIDVLWSGLARSIVMKLVEIEPRIRMRIRNFPPIGANEGTNTEGATNKTGIVLSDSDVPSLLKDRINIPEGEEYWIHNYRCMTCLNPSTNEPGLWVPHIRRKLHHDHELKDLGITAKGIRQPWTTTHRIVIGDEVRIKGMGDMLYSVALTGPIKDFEILKGFDVAVVLPIRKVDLGVQSDQLIKMKKSGRLEAYKFLPTNPNESVESLLILLKDLDPKLIQPEVIYTGDNPTEDPEFKQQLARDKMAQRVLANMGQKTIKEALK